MPGPVQTMLVASMRLAEQPDLVAPAALATELRIWLAEAAGRENDHLAASQAGRCRLDAPQPGDEAHAALRIAAVVLAAAEAGPYRVEQCRTCRAPVIWAQTARPAQRLPVDVSPSPHGSVQLLPGRGRTPTARVVPPADRDGRADLRTPHPQTCPRRPRGG